MVTYRNRAAAFLWGFMLVFMLFVVAMSYVLWRDGPPEDTLPLAGGVLAVFWLAGLGASFYFGAKPCIRVIVRPGITVLVTWRYPFKTVSLEFLCSGLQPATVVESGDDEDNPYFYARFVLPDGVCIDFTEGHDRQRCEESCAGFNAALRREQLSPSGL